MSDRSSRTARSRNCRSTTRPGSNPPNPSRLCRASPCRQRRSSRPLLPTSRPGSEGCCASPRRNGRALRLRQSRSSSLHPDSDGHSLSCPSSASNPPSSRARASPACTRRKVRDVLRQATMLLPVKIVIESRDRLAAFVGDRDARSLAKGHREETVERLLRTDRERTGLIHKVLTQAQPEEVADGRFNRRQRIAVPIDPQHYLLQVGALGRGDGEPHVRDDAWTH